MLSDRNRELLIVAMCDDSLRLVQLLSIPGDEAQVSIPLQKVMRLTVTSGCSGIVLAHNHLSGELRPSKNDLALTKRLAIATESVDIQILDHLIFSSGPPFSFRQHGLL